MLIFFLPISEYSAELLKYQGVPAHKIMVLPSGIYYKNKEQVDVSPVLPQLQRHIEGNEFYLMINRLVVEKGVYDLLYAWHLFLKKTGATAKKLVIIGKGPQEENLKRLVNEMGIDSTVFFTKNIPNHEVRKLYSRAKVLLLGSVPNSVWQEQFGYVLAEAISNECPVVTTHSGAISEVVGTAGVLVSPGNPVAFCDALIDLENTEFYLSLKQNCKTEKIKFEIELFQEKLKHVYRQVGV
jgi:glycosyltransferase involved in cell wall biosynthesis